MIEAIGDNMKQAFPTVYWFWDKAGDEFNATFLILFTPFILFIAFGFMHEHIYCNEYIANVEYGRMIKIQKIQKNASKHQKVYGISGAMI